MSNNNTFEQSAWRLFSGLISTGTGLWLLITSIGFLVPVVTAVAMLATGLYAIGSVVVPRVAHLLQRPVLVNS